MATIYAKEAVAVWKGGTAYDVTTGSGATVVTDGDAQVGMSPMEMVLAALIGCTGADVIEILRKTWRKMSPRGHEAALELARKLPEGQRKLIEQALAE